ncbi:MAG TPA: condensation domain-containing protein, partial [Thermoanaerobaculia bacterium]|nr:condensation domain-containing protein [Thermoanaerobaculia bacterium]
VPLACGGRAALAAPGEERDGPALLRRVRRERATVLQLVPSQLRAILDEGGSLGRCRDLRRLFCGGEELPAELARRALEEGGGGLALCNLYGPTEAAIDTTWHPLAGPPEGAPVPIGRPLPNLRVTLLDGAGRLVPIGAAGELHAAGAGLARGYLNRPGASAERFVPDPCSPAPGGRLYRTGDRVRFRLDRAGFPDGTLEFLGRADDQVKIRGHRVEPGEVAAALRDHPDVREAVVLPVEAPAGGRVLVAWVEADARDGLGRDLRSALEARLPEPMVPSAFVRLDALPRLPNGKLDRTALPSPEDRERSGGDTVPVRTPTEEILAGILEEVLGVEGVGAGSSYLELGGHSLLATQVASRVRSAFGVELPIRSLFETPQVADLALAVDRAAAGPGAEGPPLGPRSAPEGAELPLSFAQQRLWFLDQLHPGSASFNSSTALRLAGRLDRRALARSLREVVRRHAVLRTVFPAPGGRPVQSVRPVPARLLPRVDLTRLRPARREAEALRLGALAGRRPFDLERGPVLRARLLELDSEDHVVLFAFHHVCGDGWSTGVLVRELSTFYGAFSRGLPSPLPELPLQYADFARWQRSRLDGELLAGQAAYWREQLDGAPEGVALPRDGGPATGGGAGRKLGFEIDEDLVTSLRRLARAERATMFMVFLAGFQGLLHLASGQDDLVIGTDVANRNRVETEGLIGFFVNQLALRARFSPGLSFRGLLRQVRETALGAYAHQDMPFDRLVEVIRPGRSAGRAPLFQVKLNFQNVPAVTP